jgi:crotonobetainyl-CoA:carnitine CoA-transferase CaiB-like acyl-CoA transferase
MMAATQTDGSEMPLAGVRVLELGHYIAGPGATMALAELGADVVKIEPLTGDAARQIGRYGHAIVAGYNRGKRSVALDLHDARGIAIIERLLDSADVFVQNLRPGVPERLGLDAARLCARFPRLVHLSISGFGTQGPSRRRGGLDIAAQAESGLMSITGEPDGLPQKVGAPIIDAATAHVAAQAVLAALFRRERCGTGTTLDVSLLEVAMHLQQASWVDYLATGDEPKRIGNGQPTNAPAAEVVATSDGHIVLSAFTDEHWARLCRLLGRDALIDDPRFSTNACRVAHRPALHAVLAESLAALTSEDAVALLVGNGLVAGAVRGYRQVEASADVRANGAIVEAHAPHGGAVRVLGRPYRMRSAPPPALAAAPDTGAHTAEVLHEAGYTAADIDALLAAGVVGAPAR